MEIQIPFYIESIIYAVMAILIVFIYYILIYSLNILNLTKSKKTKYLIFTTIIIFSWLIISALLAIDGTLRDFTSVPPKLLLIIIPPVLAIIYLSNSTRVNEILINIPSSWLIYIQSVRIILEIMLWLLFIKNFIPIQMTFSGINYDILIGLSAPLVGYYCLTINKFPKLVAILWNAAGVLLISNLFLIAFLSAPTPLRKFLNEPANILPSVFPFVWLPAFIIPFIFFIHILSIKQLAYNYKINN